PVQAVFKPQRQIDHALVTKQLDNIPCAFQYGIATLALLEMGVHGCAQIRLNVALEIIRDLLPHLLAVDYHGLVPFANCNRVLHAPPNPGANKSLNMSRARKSRVLTDAVEIPRALAVSSMLMCCMSRKTKTSR